MYSVIVKQEPVSREFCRLCKHPEAYDLRDIILPDITNYRNINVDNSRPTQLSRIDILTLTDLYKVCPFPLCAKCFMVQCEKKIIKDVIPLQYLVGHKQPWLHDLRTRSYIVLVKRDQQRQQERVINPSRPLVIPISAHISLASLRSYVQQLVDHSLELFGTLKMLLHAPPMSQSARCMDAIRCVLDNKRFWHKLEHQGLCAVERLLEKLYSIQQRLPKLGFAELLHRDTHMWPLVFGHDSSECIELCTTTAPMNGSNSNRYVKEKLGITDKPLYSSTHLLLGIFNLFNNGFFEDTRELCMEELRVRVQHHLDNRSRPHTCLEYFKEHSLLPHVESMDCSAPAIVTTSVITTTTTAAAAAASIIKTEC